jgi:hypothetical protein
MKVNIQKIEGSWKLGFVLDKHVDHSEFLGTDQFGHDQFDIVRMVMTTVFISGSIWKRLTKKLGLKVKSAPSNKWNFFQSKTGKLQKPDHSQQAISCGKRPSFN